MELSDAALLRACRGGDQDAWTTLVNRYQRLIYTIPRRAGLDEQAAADVFQRVFATLVEHLDTLSDPDRLRAWLVTTARRESWRVGRQQAAARNRSASEDEAIEIPDADLLPDELLLRLERQHAVRTAVDSLDERCQEMIKLLFYSHEPLPYGELAARLGIAEGSIGPIRGRCLERLRQRLNAIAPGVFTGRELALSR
jgi:RNA polymerase sigma factor (sigma-70 family)